MPSVPIPRRVLVARLDNTGDVLLSGPLVRAVAARASVVYLCSPTGAPAARLLPGVGSVVTARAGWIEAGGPAVVVGNTGRAHLGAAVGGRWSACTRPPFRPPGWRPWMVPHVLLGDQGIACAGCRARTCPPAATSEAHSHSRRRNHPRGPGGPAAGTDFPGGSRRARTAR